MFAHAGVVGAIGPIEPVMFFSWSTRSVAEIGTSWVIGTTPTSTVVPPRPVMATDCCTVGTLPRHSNTKSAPPPVS